MDLQATLTAFLQSTKDPLGEDPRLRQLAQRLVQQAKDASRPTLDAALAQLNEGLRAPHPQVAAFVAVVGGCLVEDGADANILVGGLLPRVTEALHLAAGAVDAAARLQQVEPGKGTRTLGEHVISEADFQELLRVRTAEVQSLLALDQFCQALVAALSRQPQHLKTPLVQLLGVQLSSFTEASNFAHFLARLLRVPMHEKWWIIDPRSHRGFELSVSGVANAFQVYALVHAALAARLGWEPAPPAEVLDVAAGRGPQSTTSSYVPPFTLFRWPAAKDSQPPTALTSTREWYSSSAVPTELAWFGQARVGIVGDGGFKMELSASREFGGLSAEARYEKELERSRVAELWQAFVTTPHPGHPIPGVGWP